MVNVYNNIMQLKKSIVEGVGTRNDCTHKNNLNFEKLKTLVLRDQTSFDLLPVR